MKLIKIGGKKRLYLFIGIVVILGTAIGILSAKDQHHNALTRIAQIQADRFGFAINFRALDPVKDAVRYLSTDKKIKDVFSSKRASNEIMPMLSAIKATQGASIAYLMNLNGKVIASTRYGKNESKTLLGKNYAFRPYFIDALKDNQVVIYPALGVSTGKRGIYISNPVEEGGHKLGVVVIKVGLEKIDREFAATSSPSALVSPDGVIFAAKNPRWMFKVAKPIDELVRLKLIKSKRYAFQKLDHLGINLFKEHVEYLGKSWIISHALAGIGGWNVVIFHPDLAASVGILALHIVGYILLFTVVGFVAFLIIKLRREHRAVVEAEQRLQVIVDKSADGFLLLDDERFIDCNEASLKMLKMKNKKQLYNMHPWELSPPEQFNGEDSITLGRSMIDIAREKGFHRFEWLHRRTDGSIFPADICLTTIEINGKIVLHTTWRDITERKRSELLLDSQHRQLKAQAEELARKQKILFKAIRESENARVEADNANKSKSDFLANMSHEIRTPLNGVIGMTELLLLSELNDEQRTFVNTIKNSGSLLLGVINDILDFSKIEARKLILEEIPFSFNDMMENALSTMYYMAQEKGLEFSCTYDQEIPEFVSGDSGRLRQVLINLIANSFKFTEKGSVSAFCVVDEQMGDSIRLKFTVKDTGVGINSKKLESIFEEFNQADRSVTRKYGGTGLGLAISKQLCELMNGKIGVSSKEGEWTEFWFYVELKKCNQNVENDPIQNTDTVVEFIPGSVLQVLLAEDNCTNQLVAKKLLGKFKVELTVVENGQEAVEELARKKYDLVFMDLHMPIMDGVEATQKIRESSNMNRDIPIVAMTASAMQKDRQICFDSGMNDYMTKPISLKEVGEVLRRWSYLQTTIVA